MLKFLDLCKPLTKLKYILLINKIKYVCDEKKESAKGQGLQSKAQFNTLQLTKRYIRQCFHSFYLGIKFGIICVTFVKFGVFKNKVLRTIYGGIRVVVVEIENRKYLATKYQCSAANLGQLKLKRNLIMMGEQKTILRIWIRQPGSG